MGDLQKYISTERHTIPQNSFASTRWIYPMHYIAMSYTISPESVQNIALFDCNEGDRPVEVIPKKISLQPTASKACLVGVIGSADGTWYSTSSSLMMPHSHSSEFRNLCSQ